jgi:hypothetical protein
LNAYQLKVLTSNKKNNECLKPGSGLAKATKEYERERKGIGIHTLLRKGYLKQ